MGSGDGPTSGRQQKTSNATAEDRVYVFGLGYIIDKSISIWNMIERRNLETNDKRLRPRSDPDPRLPTAAQHGRVRGARSDVTVAAANVPYAPLSLEVSRFLEEGLRRPSHPLTIYKRHCRSAAWMTALLDSARTTSRQRMALGANPTVVGRGCLLNFLSTVSQPRSADLGLAKLASEMGEISG